SIQEVPVEPLPPMASILEAAAAHMARTAQSIDLNLDPALAAPAEEPAAAVVAASDRDAPAPAEPLPVAEADEEELPDLLEPSAPAASLLDSLGLPESLDLPESQALPESPEPQELPDVQALAAALAQAAKAV